MVLSLYTQNKEISRSLTVSGTEAKILRHKSQKPGEVYEIVHSNSTLHSTANFTMETNLTVVNYPNLHLQGKAISPLIRHSDYA